MLTQLYDLIGKTIQYQGETCQLIEVMEHGPHLVFQCKTSKSIQCNQHGNANRRTLDTYTIHCLNEHKSDLHPVLKTLLNEQQQQVLRQSLLPQQKS